MTSVLSPILVITDLAEVGRVRRKASLKTNFQVISWKEWEQADIERELNRTTYCALVLDCPAVEHIQRFMDLCPFLGKKSKDPFTMVYFRSPRFGLGDYPLRLWLDQTFKSYAVVSYLPEVRNTFLRFLELLGVQNTWSSLIGMLQTQIHGYRLDREDDTSPDVFTYYSSEYAIGSNVPVPVPCRNTLSSPIKIPSSNIKTFMVYLLPGQSADVILLDGFYYPWCDRGDVPVGSLIWNVELLAYTPPKPAEDATPGEPPKEVLATPDGEPVAAKSSCKSSCKSSGEPTPPEFGPENNHERDTSYVENTPKNELVMNRALTPSGSDAERPQFPLRLVRFRMDLPEKDVWDLEIHTEFEVMKAVPLRRIEDIGLTEAAIHLASNESARSVFLRGPSGIVVRWWESPEECKGICNLKLARDDAV